MNARKACAVLCRWYAARPGNLVHHTLLRGKSYVQLSTAALLVKEHIIVLHVAIIVVTVIGLILLS